MPPVGVLPLPGHAPAMEDFRSSHRPHSGSGLQVPCAAGRRCNNRSSGSGRPAAPSQSRTHGDTILEAREAQIERSEGEWVFCVSHDGEAISGRWGSHPSSNVQGRTWRAQPAAEPPSLLEGQGKEGSALQSRAVGRHTKTATVGTPFMVASRSCACRGISLCEQRSRRCDLVPQT